MDKKKRWERAAAQAALWLSKGLEIVHWGGAAFGAALLLLCWLFGPRAAEALAAGQPVWGSELKTYGFEIQVLYGGQANLRAAEFFSAGGVIILSLMAMVYRNIHLILQAALGRGRFSDRAGVFQPDVVRMVRKIGIFYLSAPAVGLAIANLARLVLGPDNLEASVQLDSFFTGLILLCLSQAFAYGVQLQRDADGLI